MSGRKFLDDEGATLHWLADGRWLQVGATLVSLEGGERIELGSNSPGLGAWSPDSKHLFSLIPEEIGLYANTGIYVARLNLPRLITP